MSDLNKGKKYDKSETISFVKKAQADEKTVLSSIVSLFISKVKEKHS